MLMVLCVPNGVIQLKAYEEKLANMEKALEKRLAEARLEMEVCLTSLWKTYLIYLFMSVCTICLYIRIYDVCCAHFGLQ